MEQLNPGGTLYYSLLRHHSQFSWWKRGRKSLTPLWWMWCWLYRNEKATYNYCWWIYQLGLQHYWLFSQWSLRWDIKIVLLTDSRSKTKLFNLSRYLTKNIKSTYLETRHHFTSFLFWKINKTINWLSKSNYWWLINWVIGSALLTMFQIHYLVFYIVQNASQRPKA